MKKSQSWLPYLAIVVIVVIVGVVGIISFPKSDSNIGGSAVNVVPTGAKADSFSLRGNTEKYELSQVFESDSSFPISEIGQIYGMSIEGYVDLWSEEAMAQVVLVTSSGEEKLVAEFYPLIFEDEQEDKFNICDETCLLDGVTPQQLKIYLKDATLQIDNINYIDSEKALGVDIRNKGIKAVSLELKKAQDSEKIRKINSKLEEKNKHWFAGETSVSKLAYNEKKNYLKAKGIDGKETSFPAGFEFYSGGVISVGTSAEDSLPTVENTMASASAPDGYAMDFDWRNRHGINWMTPVKSQGSCGSCWAFAAVGATEAQANLYFNQKLDLDLSEQDLLSCSGAGDCGGGSPYSALNYITKEGIVDEDSFKYTALDDNCSNMLPNSSQLIKISGKLDFGKSLYPQTEEDLKKMIIQYGPLSGGVGNWYHAMTLAGWKVIEEGDRFYFRDINYVSGWRTISSDDPMIGKTVWIFKNSWGSYYGDKGYVYVETPINNIAWTHALLDPVYSLKQKYDVLCTDNDGDGYYSWGIGEKPASCPISSSYIPDGDDSNNTLGPMDKKGNILILDHSGVQVDFLASNTQTTRYGYVDFFDQTTGTPIQWEWYFEGGIPSKTFEREPTVKYIEPGTYDVTLNVLNSDGTIYTKTKSDYVYVEDRIPMGNISVSGSSSGFPWYMDGVYMGIVGSTKIYPVISDYHVFTATRDGFADFVSTEFVPADTYSKIGITLTQVAPGLFVSSSTNEFYYSLVYVDGNYIGKTNVVTYSLSPGEHQVKVTKDGYKDYITTVNLVDAKTTSLSITLEPENRNLILPVADFKANTQSVYEGSAVSFSDISTGSPTSWLWTFAGGTPSSSNAQNPSVTYNTAGIYDVTLKATNADGSDTETKVGYITVKPKLVGGNLYISSNPAGAKVYVNKLSVGVTPMQMNDLVPGTYDVKLSLRGYTTYSTKVSVVQGQTTTVNPTLSGKTAKR